MLFDENAMLSLVEISNQIEDEKRLFFTIIISRSSYVIGKFIDYIFSLPSGQYIYENGKFIRKL